MKKMPARASVTWCGRKRGVFGVLGALTLVAFFVFLMCYAFGQGSTATSTLKLATVIFRHGDRTPTNFYPNDPYKNPQFWPDGFGALTKVGKRQMFKLGNYLRKRYDGFLSEKYSPDDIYIFSSDHDRCLMSAQLCLASLYPPLGDQIWNEDLAWQPVPVHTIPRNLDKLIVAKKPCPKYEKELKETYHGDYFSRINRENANLYKYLTEHSGTEINNVTAVENLFNTLEVEEKANLKLPQWAGKHYEEMKKLATLCLASFTFTPAAKRLKGGPLLAEIVQHTTQKLLGLLKPNRRMYLYSGHDLTLVSILRTLGFEEIQKPEYGASVIFELHQPANEADHFVELWYLNSTDHADPIRLIIPGCEEMCRVKDFIALTKSLIPQDWEAECQAV